MNRLLGPKEEIGICDACLGLDDKTKKSVHRIEEDNIYLCDFHFRGLIAEERRMDSEDKTYG